MWIFFQESRMWVFKKEKIWDQMRKKFPKTTKRYRFLRFMILSNVFRYLFGAKNGAIFFIRNAFCANLNCKLHTSHLERRAGGEGWAAGGRPTTLSAIWLLHGGRQQSVVLNFSFSNFFKKLMSYRCREIS